jgi:hypothetical protein
MRKLRALRGYQPRRLLGSANLNPSNWDGSGKLKTSPHRVSDCAKEDLEALFDGLQAADSGQARPKHKRGA